MALTDRYWWLNKIDGVRAIVRSLLAPSTLCGHENPRYGTQSCDLKRGHCRSHNDRRWVARMPKRKR